MKDERRNTSILLILLFLLPLHSFSLHGSETDQYLAWTEDIKDSKKIINDYYVD